MKLFDEIPCIGNEHIALRRITDSDSEQLRNMTLNSNVYRYLPTFLFEKQSEDVHKTIAGLYDKLFTSKESLILGIYPAKAGVLCGLAEFYGYKESLQKTCIGYRLDEQWWGKGIASDTVRLMVEYLYSKTDTEIITASTMIENKASARVLEKNGFIMTAGAVPEDWGYSEPTIADKWFR